MDEEAEGGEPPATNAVSTLLTRLVRLNKHVRSRHINQRHGQGSAAGKMRVVRLGFSPIAPARAPRRELRHLVHPFHQVMIYLMHVSCTIYRSLLDMKVSFLVPLLLFALPRSSPFRQALVVCSHLSRHALARRAARPQHGHHTPGA